MEEWISYRVVVLDEVLRLDGLGDALNGVDDASNSLGDASSGPGVCPDCSNCPAQFRCNDCSGGILHCSMCIVLQHQNLPLHRLQVHQVSRTVLICQEANLVSSCGMGVSSRLLHLRTLVSGLKAQVTYCCRGSVGVRGGVKYKVAGEL